MENSEEQSNEVLALDSIYSDGLFTWESTPSGFRGSVSVSVDLCQPIGLIHKDVAYQLEFLPPITLSFKSPADYPSDSPPHFKLRCVWMKRMEAERLRELLLDDWNSMKGSPILFQWIQSISEKTVEVLSPPLDTAALSADLMADPSSHDCCDSSKPEGMQRRQISRPGRIESGRPSGEGRDSSRRMAVAYTPDQIFAILNDYNRMQQQEIFNRQLIECQVCCEEMLGINCIRFLECGHTFCKSCVTQYLELRVKEGSVVGLKCLATACSTEISQREIRELISEELFLRYDELLLRRTLETMGDVANCPRLSCQQAVIIDPNVPDLGRCPNCAFNFCVYCKKGYHGVAPCELADKEKRRLFEEYTTASHEVKMLLEKRYGRKQMKLLVEDTLAMAWINDNSKPCPNCKSKIEKNDGCNKMSCAKCGAYFCWLCMKLLNHTNPYLHFNSPKGECFNRLFEGAEGGDDFEPFEDEFDDDDDD